METNMVRIKSAEDFVRWVEARPGHLEPIPEDDRDFPVPGPQEKSTCKCGEKYTADEFFALKVPAGRPGTWSAPALHVELVVRTCKCGNRIARRVV